MSQLANLLELHAASLQERWLLRLRAERLPGDASEPQLARYLPALLAALRSALQDAGQPVCDVAPPPDDRPPSRRAHERDALVREYSLLSECIFDLLDDSGTALTVAEQRILTRFVAHAMVAAVREPSPEQPSAAPTPQLQSTRLHNLVQNAPAFVAMLRGPTHIFELVNAPYQRLVGVGRTLIGRAVAAAVPEVVPQGFVALLDGVYRTGRPQVGSETLLRWDRHGDGQLADAWVNFLYQPTRNAAGAVDGIDVFGFDVTGQVQARQRSETLAAAVRASETQLRLVMDAIPLMVSFVTADERYGLVNKAYAQRFAQPQEALLGRTVAEVVGASLYSVIGPYVQQALGGQRVLFEQHGVPARSSTRDVKVEFVPHRDAAGRPSGYIAVVQDITKERRWAEAHERLAHQRSEVLESMGDAFFALDQQWRIILVNQRYERLAHKAREELLGHNFWALFPDAAAPSSPHFQAYHCCMRERAAVQFLDHYAATELWTEVRVYPTPDGGIAIFFRDVSSEKKAEAMHKQQSEFEQQLIGIVSHDLRNPLNLVQMGATVLGERRDLDPRARKTVQRIQSATTRALRLISDLLDFTQARLGGGIRIAPLPAELHELTRGMVEEVAAAYPSREVAVTCAGDGHGHWDADRIGQVVQNLVLNALKYSPHGTLVEVVTRGAADAVTLAVHNQGPPIPPEWLESIFQPMQRGSEGVDKAGRSVGLGLYIVQSIVAAHRGEVAVRSTADCGTTFTVWLPRTAGAPAHKKEC